MQSKTSSQDVGVLSHTLKMTFPLVLTLASANMEDHSQQSRLKMSKTFLRLLPVILLGCSLVGSLLTVNQLSNKINQIISKQITNKPTAECYLNKFYITMTFYIATVLIPLYEFIIYPVFRKHFSWVKSHHKVLLGALLHMARVITLMAFALKIRHTSLEHNGYNSTVQCIFQEDKVTLGFDSKWMILQKILESLSIVALYVGAAEFICAQTPYSMRGLMFGVAYGCGSLFVLIGYGITQPFQGKSTTLWGTRMIGCEFWYSLLNILFLVITGTLFIVLIKLYTRRKRDDLLPNEQIFAERYYATGN